MKAQELEFKRHLTVAWSCLKDVEHKSDEIREARDASEQVTKEGSFRGALAMGALRGQLQRDFEDELVALAWQSATSASATQGDRFVELVGVPVTPGVIFGGVYSPRADLTFALERWDDAAQCYIKALEHEPDNPDYLFNLGAPIPTSTTSRVRCEHSRKPSSSIPTGEYGIEAPTSVARLRAGRLGQRAFTGSWKVVGALGVLTLIALLMIGSDPGGAFMNLMLWGGLLALYWFRKHKYRADGFRVWPGQHPTPNR